MSEFQLIMGNEAIALGALKAGVNLVAGYPGTPSTEILETVAKYNLSSLKGSVHVEWSVNEKAALEVAAGASYSGARTLVTMKQVGLNVASDPLMSLAYVGVKGGLVIVSADDPGPISSQTEQDTRHFAHFCKLPVFDPSSPEEAYKMIQDAFVLSEKYSTPVLFRPTTRVCHGCASMEVPELEPPKKPEGFIKDTMRWVIFPRTSYMNHIKIEKRNNEILPDELSKSKFNILTNVNPEKINGKRLGIVTGGISYEYTREALSLISEKSKINISLLKIGTPFPFPEKLALDFLNGVDEVFAIEELDPVLERELIYLTGKHNLKVAIKGKLSGAIQPAGENTVESVLKAVRNFYFGAEQSDGNDSSPSTSEKQNSNMVADQVPELPVRPPVLCAGCPHRASFYAVKQAMKGHKSVFCGDIGCYTLGNAKPLDMTDTCLCMGADITIAQGIFHTEPETACFSFIGDSTFFAAGLTGIVNAVYNQAKITIIILDNSTTAMTGHQPHPGTGMTMMGNVVEKVNIEKVLEGLGVGCIQKADPLNLKESVAAVKKARFYTENEGQHLGNPVSAVIFKSPCIAVAAKLGVPAAKKLTVDSAKCIGCKKCINELGCPALVLKTDADKKKKAFIESSLCFGCNVCAQVCPVEAIQR